MQSSLNISGEDECEVPPVPIPNTEVKLDIADDSWGSPPVKIGFRQFFYIKKASLKGCFFVLLDIEKTVVLLYNGNAV